MLAHIRIVILLFLLHISFTTSNNVIQKKPIVDNGGWRCGRKIITHETFQAATNNAINHVASNAGSNPNEIDHLFPERYKGYFGFKGENGHNLLWPFIDSELSLVSNEKSSQSIFFVLQSRPRGQLGPLGVVEKISTNNYRRCIRERDLSDMWGHVVVNGLRCPQDTFPMDMVEKELESAKKNVQKTRYRTIEYPIDFDGSNIFDSPGPLAMWPVTMSSGFHPKALASIIFDHEFNLIGMVHRKGDNYFRCTVTPYLDRMPKFLSTIFLRNINPPSGEDDIFDCGRELIKSSMVLKSSIEAPPGFKFKSRAPARKFPRRFSRPDDENDAEEFYLWPVIMEGSSVYKIRESKPNSKIFKNTYGIYLVINDFSDIAAVMKETSIGIFEPCERKTIFSHNTYPTMTNLIGKKREREH